MKKSARKTARNAKRATASTVAKKRRAKTESVAAGRPVRCAPTEPQWQDPRPEALAALAQMAVYAERHTSPASVERMPDGVLRVIGPEFGPVFVTAVEWASAVDVARGPHETSRERFDREYQALKRPTAEQAAELRAARWGRSLGALGTAMHLGNGNIVACAEPHTESIGNISDLEWVMVETRTGAILSIEHREGDAVAVREVGRRSGDGFEVTSPELEDPPYGLRGIGQVHNPEARCRFEGKPVVAYLNAEARAEVLAIADALAATGDAEQIAKLRALAGVATAEEAVA